MDHDSRTYIQSSESVYALPVDSQERERLRLQHSIIRRTVQKVIRDDQSIQWPFLVADPNFRLQPGDQVLDSGTGGGDWLLDAADTFSKTHPASTATSPEARPLVIFKGIDISTANFPSPPFLIGASASTPVSISFSEQNVTSLPGSWSSTFTLIHQRYLLFALPRSQWVTTFNEFHRVLRPGGWLSVLEGGGIAAGTHMERFRRFLKLFFNKRDLIDIHDMEREITEMLRAVRSSDQKKVNSGDHVIPSASVSAPEGAVAAEVTNGFIPSSITARRYRMPFGAAHYPPGTPERQLAEDTQANFLSSARGIKLSFGSPDSSGNETSSDGLYGFRNEREYGELLDKVEVEINETKDAYVELLLVNAQKSFD